MLVMAAPMRCRCPRGSVGFRGVDRRLPRGTVGHQLLRRGHRSRAASASSSTPGKDAAAGVAEVVREHRLKPVAVLVTHGHIDHMWCVAPVAGTLRRHGLDPPARPAPADRPDGRHVAGDRPRCCWAATTSGPSPTTSGSSTDGAGARAGRPAVRGRPHPGPHRGLGDLPDAVRATAGRLGGDVLRRPALRRLDRPHRPARRRPPHDAAQPAPSKVLPLADDIVVLPGHGEQTSIGRERATNPFLRELLDSGRRTSHARSLR